MTAPTEHRTTASAGRGERWIARCSCEWWTPCTGSDDASQRMDEHRRVARAYALLPEGHDCYFNGGDMERGPADNCRHCQLEPVLRGRAAA